MEEERKFRGQPRKSARYRVQASAKVWRSDHARGAGALRRTV